MDIFLRTILGIIGIISLSGLVAGLLNPKFVRCSSRKKVALIFGGTFFVFCLTMPDEEQEENNALARRAREVRELKEAQAREQEREKERLEQERKEREEANIRIDLASVPKWIDLGLPSGTLWAEWNLGATKPEGYGEYFAWGETSGTSGGKRRYAWNTYKLCNGASDLLIKYCSSDHKHILESVDDAATKNWGKGWQIPSKNQFDELRANCKWEYVTRENVKGYLVTSMHNSNKIFFPLSGYCDENESLWFRNSTGYYWSQELDASYWTGTNKPYCLILEKDETKMSSSRVERCEGISIRPVRVQKAEKSREDENSDYSRGEVKREKSEKEKLEETLNTLENMLLLESVSNY